MKAPGARIGWIGVGNMGRPLVTRLLNAGCDVAIYNRTRSRAEPLAQLGGRIVDRPRDLSDRDIVFSVVAGSDDFVSVMLGKDGLLRDESSAPRLIVDSSTISGDASQQVREVAQVRGSILLAAPISGNGRHVAGGGALFAVSGPSHAVDEIRPYLAILGRDAHHIGDGDDARQVKIAHNLLLGAIIQSLAETTLLLEAQGVSRRAYLDFINDSPLGSVFSAYKTPALVELDWTPTFSMTLLAKDLDLGLEAGAGSGVPLPVTQAVRVMAQAAVDAGYGEDDFAALLAAQAAAAGVSLTPRDPAPASH